MISETNDLSGGELLVASIVSVVHVIVWKKVRTDNQNQARDISLTDGVNTFSRASIASLRASRCGTGLSRSVIDVVTIGVTSILEGVVKSHPVANLVSNGSPEVEGCARTPWDRRVQENDAVVKGSRRIGFRESSISQKTCVVAGGESVPSR